MAAAGGGSDVQTWAALAIVALTAAALVWRAVAARRRRAAGCGGGEGCGCRPAFPRVENGGSRAPVKDSLDGRLR